MSSNVGLSTPRGSGTSGYVQRNLSHLKPRHQAAPYSLDHDRAHRQRKPDPDILEHERRRKIEVQVFELRDQLEEEGIEEDEIDDRCDALRKKLDEEDAKGDGSKTDARGLKGYQVHDLAKAKIEETEKMRRALGIREDYEEGAHWKRQEERLRETLKEKAEVEEEMRRERKIGSERYDRLCKLERRRRKLERRQRKLEKRQRKLEKRQRSMLKRARSKLKRAISTRDDMGFGPPPPSGPSCIVM